MEQLGPTRAVAWGWRLRSGGIIGLYDRSLKNSRDALPVRYELPVYARDDLAARWSGWDGWYVLMVPREKRCQSGRSGAA